MSAADKIAEIEKRRAERKGKLATEEAEQFAKDFEALDELEVKHGDGVIGAVKTPRFAPGLPTRVLFRAPSGPEYQRYLDTYGRATTKESPSGQRDALITLARACWLYPAEAEAKDAINEAFPGLIVGVGLAAAKKAEAAKAEEGKD